MKKIFVLLLSLILCFSFAGCSADNNGNARIHEFTARYDYGLHVENKATALLDDSEIFFDLKELNVDTLIGGDVITLKYTGELLIQESYPSKIQTNQMTVKNISLTKAVILEFEVVANAEGEPILCVKDGDDSRFKSFANQYIINEDMSFGVLDESHIGKTVYGTYSANAENEEIEIIALYSYRPR